MTTCKRCGCEKDVVAVPSIGAAHYWDRCLWWVVKPAQRALTNLLTNPSFERGLDPWVGTTVGSSLSISQEESFRGLQSVCVQSGDAAPNLATYGIRNETLIVPAGRTYCVTFWVKGCPGDRLEADFTYQISTGLFSDDFQFGHAALELSGDWQEVSLCLVNRSVADLATFLDINVVERAGACDTFYLDAVVVVDHDEPVSYFDGDTHGATWDGVPHGSVSRVAANQRQVGTPVNVQECGLNPIGDAGWGMPQVQPVVLSFARRPGALYQRSHVLPRPISIRGTVEGCPCDVHQARSKLVQLVGLWDVEQCDQEFLIRYQWTNDCGELVGEPLEIPATYVSGLEGDRSDLQRQIIELGFVAHEYPLWRSVGDRCQVLEQGTNIVNYGGTAAAPITLELQGPGGIVSLANNTNGSFLRFGTDVINGLGLGADEYMRFSSQPGEVSVIRYNNTTQTNALSEIDYTVSRPARWRLTPGENEVVVAGGFPVTLCWRENHLSADAVRG